MVLFASFWISPPLPWRLWINCILVELRMKKQDALFQLIKSLSRGEKRNFRMLAQLTSGDKKYLQLFDVFDLMEEYDEAKVLKKFKKDANFEKQFAYNKNYLYNSILNALTYFRKGTDAERSSLTLQVRILLEKNLYTHAQKLLRKVKDKNVEQEKFEDLLPLFKLEIEILRRVEATELLPESFRKIEFEEKIALDKILNLREYRRLELQTHILLVTRHVARKQEEIASVDRILEHPLMQGESEALSNRARILYNELHRRIAQFKADWATAIQYGERVVEIYDTHTSLIEEERLLYMRQISHLAHHHTVLNGIERSLPWVLRIRDIEATTAQERVFKFERYYLFALGYMQDTGQRASEPFLKEFDHELDQLENDLAISLRLYVSYLRSQYHFVLAEYSEALKWINRCINHPRTNIRSDLQSSARLLNMLVHYELGNLEVIEYSIKSAYRFIYKQDRMNQFERRFLGFFRRVLAAPNARAIQEETVSYKQDLTEILKDPFEFQASHFLKVDEWLDSKISGKPLAEVLEASNSFLIGEGKKITI
jgi:hypothetical protein